MKSLLFLILMVMVSVVFSRLIILNFEDLGCLGCGQRLYRGKLKKFRADRCQVSTAIIPGTVQSVPATYCKDFELINKRGDEMEYFVVNEEAGSCDFGDPKKLHWGKFRDEGCDPHRSTTRVYSSRLWGIESRRQWETVCENTKARPNNTSLCIHPTSCNDMGLINGVRGTFLVYDNKCR